MLCCSSPSMLWRLSACYLTVYTPMSSVTGTEGGRSAPVLNRTDTPPRRGHCVPTGNHGEGEPAMTKIKLISLLTTITVFVLPIAEASAHHAW
jgi:hypothetical protein